MKEALVSLKLYFVLDYKQQIQQDFTNIFYKINFLNNPIYGCIVLLSDFIHVNLRDHEMICKM